MKKLEDILTDVTGLSATNILETLKKEFSKNEILEFSVEDFLCIKGIGSKKAKFQSHNGSIKTYGVTT